MQKNELPVPIQLTPFFKRNPFLLERGDVQIPDFLDSPVQLPERPDSDSAGIVEDHSKSSYDCKDHCDKHIFLDTVNEVLDSREIPLLKDIIITEDNEELREKALAILNGLSHQQYWYSEEERAVLEIEKIRERSIFKPLFELGDRRSKFMLLDEMANLGGTKELVFLDSLSEILDPLLKKRISKTKSVLQERMQRISLDELLKHVPDQLTQEPVTTIPEVYGQLLDQLSIKPYDSSAPMDLADTIKKSSLDSI